MTFKRCLHVITSKILLNPNKILQILILKKPLKLKTLHPLSISGIKNWGLKIER